MSLAETETNINNCYYCYYHFTAIASDVRPINSYKLPNNLIIRNVGHGPTWWPPSRI